MTVYPLKKVLFSFQYHISPRYWLQNNTVPPKSNKLDQIHFCYQHIGQNRFTLLVLSFSLASKIEFLSIPVFPLCFSWPLPLKKMQLEKGLGLYSLQYLHVRMLPKLFGSLCDWHGGTWILHSLNKQTWASKNGTNHRQNTEQSTEMNVGRIL